MLGFLCKRIGFPQRVQRFKVETPSTSLGFLQCNDDDNTSLLFFRRFSAPKSRPISVGKNKLEHSFTVNYLINSCGLSPVVAKSVAKKVHFETPERPDSVLALLESYGLTKPNISKLVKGSPQILSYDPWKNLVPKLDFFLSIGVSATDLPRILSSRPNILMRSLDKAIIPYYNFIKSVVNDDEKVVKFLRFSIRAFASNTQRIAANISLLRELGTPESSISTALTCHASLILQSPEKFKEIAEKVIKLGFDPLKFSFLAAMASFSSMGKTTWECKIHIYGRWGLSENECFSMFKRLPVCMRVSENKIMGTMDYLVNRMGWNATIVSRHPLILCYSLENRIVPRCSVIRVLITKGLINEEVNPNYFLVCGEKRFVKNFVKKYEKDVPELLCFYQRKISLSELGFQPDDIYAKKS